MAGTERFACLENQNWPMTRQDILLVEDEGIIATDIQARLEKLDYRVTTTRTSEEALDKISAVKPDVVLMDIHLQGEMDGIEAANLIRRRFDLPVVFLTGLADESLVERAKTVEPYGYIIKPIEELELHSVLQIAHYRHKLEQDRAKLLVTERETLQSILDGLTKMLSELLAATAPQSLAQGQKAQQYMHALAQALEIPDSRELETAALLSQIGYLYLQPTLIQKVRAGLTLSPNERELLTRMPEFGRKLFGRLPRMEPVSEIIYYQRKNFDGTGFPPDDVAGLKIPLGARMLRIVIDLCEIEAAGTPRRQISDQMRNNSGCYDPGLLGKAIEALIDAPPPGSRGVKLSDLAIGDLLVAPIESSEGTILIGAGTKMTQLLLQKIHQFAESHPIHEPIFIETRSSSSH